MDMQNAVILTGGLTNKLFLVTSPEKDNKKTLVRVYGDGTDILVNRQREINIMYVAHEKGLGPKILSVDNGMRREEYLDGYLPLKNRDLFDRDLLQKVCFKMKKLHHIEINIDKEPRIIRNLTKWLEPAKKINAEIFEVNKVLDMIERLKSYNGKIGLCHNDLNPSNILRKGESIRLIDFEFSGYNFIEFDIANMFLEMGIDIVDGKAIYYGKYLEYEEYFCDEYGISMENIKMFKDASNMMWTLWAIIMSHDNKQFDYLTFAKFRWELTSAP